MELRNLSALIPEGNHLDEIAGHVLIHVARPQNTPALTAKQESFKHDIS